MCGDANINPCGVGNKVVMRRLRRSPQLTVPSEKKTNSGPGQRGCDTSEGDTEEELWEICGMIGGTKTFLIELRN